MGPDRVGTDPESGRLTMALLQTRKLTKHFDGLAAVNGLDLAVEKGEIVGLIGPNGAGKTTCFNLLSGFHPPTCGEIHFLGKKISGEWPFTICSLVICRTFQNLQFFGILSVLEYVMVVSHS